MLLGRSKAEREYFRQRKADAASGGLPAYLAATDRRLNKDLFIELLRILKRHDIRGTVALLANTTTNISKETGLMINKGMIPQKVIVYIQDTRLKHIDEMIRLIKENKPNFEGCYHFEDKMAAELNLPAGVVLFPVFSRQKPEFAAILVFKKSVENKKELIKRINKALMQES